MLQASTDVNAHCKPSKLYYVLFMRENESNMDNSGERQRMGKSACSQVDCVCLHASLLPMQFDSEQCDGGHIIHMHHYYPKTHHVALAMTAQLEFDSWAHDDDIMAPDLVGKVYQDACQLQICLELIILADGDESYFRILAM